MGDAALLMETTDPQHVLALHAALRASPAPGQQDAVPGARTVLVRVIPGTDLDAVARHLRRLRPGRVADQADQHVVIDVVYDGADLDEVGALTGLGAAGVVAAHLSSRWRVAFTGFAPGFGYLTGGDPRLRVSRRATSRTEVPAGSVGLAGDFTGIYPRSSPGGWQLIGRTDAILWETQRRPPALLAPGTWVKFRDVTGERPGSVREVGVRDAAPHRAAGRESGAPSEQSDARSLSVVRPGIACTVQDLGRLGLGSIGVPVSGAADRGAAARANRIVGNSVGAAVLEVTLGRLSLTAHGAVLIAVSGAPVDITITGRDGRDGILRTPAASGGDGGIDEPATGVRDGSALARAHVAGVPPAGPGGALMGSMDTPVPVADGQTVTLGRPTVGLRSYLAVRGGIDVRPELGSRSTDLLSGIGPEQVAAGDVLTVGAEHMGVPHPILGQVICSGTTAPTTFSVLPGPRADWFDSGAFQLLLDATWQVTPNSNRVGLRLRGPVLPRVWHGELPSEGLVPGAIQVQPAGEPVLFLADHPVTGGYPVIAVIARTDVDRAAQLRPGGLIRFSLPGGSGCDPVG